MDIQSIIATRRDKGTHTPEELKFLAQAAATNSVPDYQLAAWLMAAYLNPLTEQETAELTVAMADSGDRIDLTGLPKPWVDKHSTGGVGDKTTLVVLPILAACGLTVVKMSGRGLGVTGGTVDKLESIPGFRMNLSPEEMKEQAKRIGLAITGQTPNLAPADKTLYALRDATETTESMPLIASSVLSKKIAGGAEYLSLDVKCGSGAFMKTFEQAHELAMWLKRIGERAGLKVHAAITDMDQPLGRMVGNALEVREAKEVLARYPMGAATGRFAGLCTELSAQTLHFVGKAKTLEDARQQVEKVVHSGMAFATMIRWFEAQGASEGVLDFDSGRVPKAPVQRNVFSKESGWVVGLRADIVGEAVVELGGGRKRKEDSIDPSVGVEVITPVNAVAGSDRPVFVIHAASEESAVRAEEALLEAIVIGPGRVNRPVVLATL